MTKDLNNRLKRWAQTFTDFSFSNLRLSRFSPIHTFVNSAYLDFGAQSQFVFMFFTIFWQLSFFLYKLLITACLQELTYSTPVVNHLICFD